MNTTLKLAALVLALGLPLSAQAHKAWLLPSSTVVTPKESVTVDAAVSNDLFYFNHVPLRLDGLVITAPDGSVVTPENVSTGKYRSTFDLALAQAGTYRLSTGNNGLNASYKIGTETKRWRGSAEAFAKEVPADATDLQVSQGHSPRRDLRHRRQTERADGQRHRPGTGAGHASERSVRRRSGDVQAADRRQAGGWPRASRSCPAAFVTATKQDEITATSGADGAFSVTWPNAGVYWLEVVATDDKTSLPQAKQRRLSYVATLEVLPQ